MIELICLQKSPSLMFDMVLNTPTAERRQFNCHGDSIIRFLQSPFSSFMTEAPYDVEISPFALRISRLVSI